ncbi:hypothetical protein X772_36260 [Mesorhizobium sp. LSJC280B00]|nr:hypothetical protein X772_36260 [Mesorhizobium sp. LSJC280B00]
MMTDGLFPLPHQQSAFVPIADGEAEVGTAGPTAASKISRSRASP